MTDPQVAAGAECPHCLEWQFDNQEDFAPSGKCWTCEEIEVGDEDDTDDGLITLGEAGLSINDYFKRIFG